MRTPIFRDQVVDASTKGAAQILGELLGEAFYLAGGTGVALRLGHRTSLDLDLFSERERLKEVSRGRILDQLRDQCRLEVLLDQEGTMHLRIDGVAVSLFAYPYPLLEAPGGKWQGLRIAGLTDILGMKLNAVVGRGSKKDFVDVYFLLRKLGPAKGLKAAMARFPDHPTLLPQSLKALVYFEDAEKEPMPRMKIRCSWIEVRSYFEREIPRLARSLLAGLR